jgi:hypothetical protein
VGKKTCSAIHFPASLRIESFSEISISSTPRRWPRIDAVRSPRSANAGLLGFGHGPTLTSREVALLIGRCQRCFDVGGRVVVSCEPEGGERAGLGLLGR